MKNIPKVFSGYTFKINFAYSGVYCKIYLGLYIATIYYYSAEYQTQNLRYAPGLSGTVQCIIGL